MTVCRCSDPCEIGCVYFGEINGFTPKSHGGKPVCKECMFMMWSRAEPLSADEEPILRDWVRDWAIGKFDDIENLIHEMRQDGDEPELTKFLQLREKLREVSQVFDRGYRCDEDKQGDDEK